MVRGMVSIANQGDLSKISLLIKMARPAELVGTAQIIRVNFRWEICHPEPKLSELMKQPLSLSKLRQLPLKEEHNENMRICSPFLKGETPMKSGRGIYIIMQMEQNPG